MNAAVAVTPLAIATSGIVVRGLGLLLGWPEPHEFDGITELRNRESISKWFLDGRKLDPAANREWLAHGMKRGNEGLLSIRWIEDDAFLGTVGWSGWCARERSACFGRLMLDPRALTRRRPSLARNHPGIAVAAATLLRDHVFEAMGLRDITSWYIEDNRLAARVNEAIGMEIVGRGCRQRSDGRDIATVNMRLTREQWLALRGRP